MSICLELVFVRECKEMLTKEMQDVTPNVVYNMEIYLGIEIKSTEHMKMLLKKKTN